jgi:hypothetical protein
MAFRKYHQNFILASSSRLMEICFISKLNNHPVDDYIVTTILLTIRKYKHLQTFGILKLVLSVDASALA